MREIESLMTHETRNYNVDDDESENEDTGGARGEEGDAEEELLAGEAEGLHSDDEFWEDVAAMCSDHGL